MQTVENYSRNPIHLHPNPTSQGGFCGTTSADHGNDILAMNIGFIFVGSSLFRNPHTMETQIIYFATHTKMSPASL